MSRQPNSYTLDTSTVITTDAGFVIDHSIARQHIKQIKYSGFMLLSLLATLSTLDSQSAAPTVAITHKQLSTLTGISIPTISRSIVRLASAGLITY